MSSASWAWGARCVAAHVAERLPGAMPVGAPERLAGGLLNVVWRMPVAGVDGTSSVIVKCVPPFVASAPEVPLSPSRLSAEARASSALGTGGVFAGVATNRVRAPRLLDADDARSVLVMEDAGALPDLGEWLATAPVSEALDAGRALGAFVGRLHRATLGHADAARLFNPDVQATRLAVQYRAVGGWLADAGVADADALGASAVAMGERFTRPGRCLVMGDLWPPSVLVAPDGRLTVIDWELSTWGEPAQDLGHLAAHLWLLGRLDVWAAFVDGYRDAAGASLPALLDGATPDGTARHAACEVLARTAGAFRDSAHASDEAVGTAARWLRTPAAAALFDALRA